MEKAIVFLTMDFHGMMIVVRNQHPQKLDAIFTMMKIVVPNKTHVTKEKEIATMIGTA